MNKYPDYKDALIAKFTNGAGAAVDPTEVLTIPTAVTSSEGKVTVEMIFNGAPNTWYPGDRNVSARRHARVLLGAACRMPPLFFRAHSEWRVSW